MLLPVLGFLKQLTRVNWDLVKAGGTKDIVFKPGNPDVLYAGSGGNFYRSLDAGENWEQITNGRRRAAAARGSL
ncbi:MAG: hypothetical protein R2764_00875 [Bacteroidales bacterium]